MANGNLKLVGAHSPEEMFSGQKKENGSSFSSGSGDGGGDDLAIRITKLEIIIENQQSLMKDIKEDMRGIRSDIQVTERRLIDKIDENHKWVMGMIISSIIVPLLIALVTK
ncbi:hypothetical protein TUM17580_31830 [Citrobacter farmeri]|uniref:hypothetical protein n=1 Tax=Citrobacter farmeri TaxID=67824 RepID=UPI001B97814E|nr:hypothetical protein [Citrobacter farmeri]EKU0079881.1 hypothetical protein [Citrobacter farmeri]EKZ2528310.1 hypothetical protein [Citrobacter farmeri]GJL47124.1 hypothetical protein TUM17580_31830 [Citrobacter farmeri]HBC6430095.1 hypothetical protein [Citrobacter amalonaticus]